MTEEKASRILDTLIEQDKSFAIYRLPGDSAPRFVMQETGLTSLYRDIDELNGKQGFVFAPFRITEECPVILLRPDRTELPDIDLPVRNTKKGETRIPESTQTDRDGYGKLFGCFREPLVNGRMEKLVLSRSKTIGRDETFSPGRSFFHAAEKYIYSCVYLFHTPQSGTWLGSTPEILLSGGEDQWKTIALAGTRFPNSGSVSWDEKNFREQELVSSYLIEQLAGLRISAERNGPYTVKAGELAHLRTDFNFRLADTSSLGSLLKTLHPTPAISGLPKKEAYEFIRENEGYNRLYYAGFLGMLDGNGRTDIYVNLRCMLIQKSSLTLFAGGGLLASSSPEEEWEETEHKLRTMLGILK